jgi:hypothetical protein
MAIAVLLLQVLAAAGYGAMALAGLGLHSRLSYGERLAWALALGIGLIGWAAFLLGAAGMLTKPATALMLLAGVGGAALLGRPQPLQLLRLGGWEWLLVAVLAWTLGLEVIEAMAPPSDADSLMYHFDIPRRMAETGHLPKASMAVEGIVPLLVQTSYAPAFLLGGEQAMTLWTMASAWAVGLVAFFALRHHVGRGWALAGAAVVLTTPTVVYGGGSGQVETRIAAFCLVAALAAARSMRERDWRMAALAGMAAGFYAGAKILGLFFVAGCGLVVLMQRRWLAAGFAFGIAALLAGGQWYLWNFLHTGDPFFPMLWGLVPYHPGLWNDAQHAAFLAEWSGEEKVLPQTPPWALAYPFIATLDGPPIFDSGRAGLGPYGLLILPFALAGLWSARRRLAASPLLPVAAITLAVYLLWFHLGPSQRVRHLLPLWPLAVVMLTVAAVRCAERWGMAGRLPLIAVLTVTLGLQGAGVGAFSVSFVKRLVHGESREAFLGRMVTGFAPVPWLNAHLGASDRLLLNWRPMPYFLDMPFVFAHHAHSAAVDVRVGSRDFDHYVAQLRELGVTHVLIQSDVFPPDETKDQPFEPYGGMLVKRGCATVVASIPTSLVASRTLGGGSQATATVLALDWAACTVGRR